MFALLESCLPFFKFSKKPTQPYSSAFFFSNFTPLLFLNPILGSWHRRKPSAQSVHMRRSCQCSINYGAGCELAVRKDQQIRLKGNWCTHTHTSKHTLVSSQHIRQKHSLLALLFRDCQLSEAARLVSELICNPKQQFHFIHYCRSSFFSIAVFLQPLKYKGGHTWEPNNHGNKIELQWPVWGTSVIAVEGRRSITDSFSRSGFFRLAQEPLGHHHYPG